MKATSVAAVVIALCVAPGATAQHQPGSKPDHMEHRFDDPAKYAKSFDDPARDAWQMPDKVIQALAITEGMSVADIGSGTGYFSVRLAKAAPRATIYGADIEPKMVEYLSKRAAAEHLTNITAVLAGSAAQTCHGRWIWCWWSIPTITCRAAWTIFVSCESRSRPRAASPSSTSANRLPAGPLPNSGSRLSRSRRS